MNIGVDSRSLGPMKTGVGTYVSEVLRHWPTGHSPDSFVLFSHQAIAYPESPAVRHSVAHARWGLSWYLLQAHRLIAQNPSAVFWGAQGLLPLRLSKLCPAAITIHDCIHQQGVRFAPSAPYNWAHRGLLPLAARRARRILVVSRFVADEVMRCFRVPASKIEVTPLGVRREFFGEVKASQDGDAVLAKYGIRSPFVLGVGTLEPRKNLRTLLEAFALLPSRLGKPVSTCPGRKARMGNGKPGKVFAELREALQLGLDRLRCRSGLAGYVRISQDVCLPIVL